MHNWPTRTVHTSLCTYFTSIVQQGYVWLRACCDDGCQEMRMNSEVKDSVAQMSYLQLQQLKKWAGNTG